LNLGLMNVTVPSVGDSRAISSGGNRRPRATVSLVGVVDDDESVREALGSLIRSAGYNCQLFPSAEAFLETGHLEETDCMVLDVRMPGLSGLDLQRRLREMGSAIPIVFVTGGADEQLRDRALQDGAVAFFGKPFNDEALLSAVGAALDSSARLKE
jgi:FixJ family two-component response regulator